MAETAIWVILVILAALAVGVIVGWLLGTRQAAVLRVHADQAQETRRMWQEVVLERDRHLADLTDLRARSSEREAALQASHDRLLADKEALGAQFAETAARLLENAQAQFLKRADERFKQSEESAGQGLKLLLQPVHDRLQKYEESVQKTEAERQNAFGLLHGQIESMRGQTERVSSEAAKLVNALRNAPKARGRWGEQQLKNVLESCGLSEHADFATEVSVEGESGRLRPDVIINVPGGQSLVIDAKVSLNAYQDAFGAVDEADRALALTAHANSMRAHVNALGNKAYWSQFESAPDYVIMFVPGEHFLSAALEHDPSLWDFAFEKRVLLATPTNLIAIARTVAAVWRQEKLAKEARRIGELGKELYDRLAVAAGHLRVVGSGLSTAVGNYNKFVGSFERNVLSTGRKFKELNVETGAREIDELQPIEALARYGEGDENVVPLLKSDGAG